MKIIYDQQTSVTPLKDDIYKLAEINNVVSIGTDSLIIQDRTQALYLVVKDSVVNAIGKKGNAPSEYSYIRSIARNQDTIFILDSEIGKIVGYDLTTNQCVMSYQSNFLRSIGSLTRYNSLFSSARPMIKLTEKLKESGQMPLKANTDNFLFSFTFDSLGKVQKKPLISSESMQLTLASYLPMGNSFAHSFPNKKYNIYSDLLFPYLWLQNKENSKFQTLSIMLESPSNEKVKSVADPNLSLTDKVEKELIYKSEYIEYINVIQDTVVVASKFMANGTQITLRFYDLSGKMLATTKFNIPKDALSFQCISIENGQIIFLTVDTPKNPAATYPYSFRRMTYSLQPA